MSKVAQGLQLNRISLLVGLVTLCISLFLISSRSQTWLLWFPLLLAPLLAAWGQVLCMRAPVGRGLALMAFLCTAFTILVNVISAVVDGQEAFGSNWFVLNAGAVFLSLVFMLLLIGRLGSHIGHPEFGRQGAMLLIAPLGCVLLGLIPGLGAVVSLGLMVVIVAGIVAYSGLLGRVANEIEAWEREQLTRP